MQLSKREYATVGRDDGVNYREIAEIMSELGYSMNHSSARNHLLRIMRRFCSAYCEAQGFNISDAGIDDVCRSPGFQQAVSQMIQQIEINRKIRPSLELEPVSTIDEGCVRRKVYSEKGRLFVCYEGRRYFSVVETRTIVPTRVTVRRLNRSRVEVHMLEGPIEAWVEERPIVRSTP